MSASFFYVAATASTTSSSSSNTSLHPFTQKPKFSIEHFSLTTNTHFNIILTAPICPLYRSSIFKTCAVSDDQEDVESVEDGRLYVGNLPFSVTSSQLSDIFAEAGTVSNVEIVYDRVTDRSRGFAFVTMASVEEAKEAIRLFDGSQVGGRIVKVNFPEVPRGGEREVMGAKIRSSYQGFIDSPHKLYAANLGWGLTSQGLRDAFANQPGFLSAKVIYDRSSGRSRGFGFVTFSSAEAMNSALDTMNEVEVVGRPLRLTVAGQKAPVSSPPVVETSPENDSENSEIFFGVNS